MTENIEAKNCASCIYFIRKHDFENAISDNNYLSKSVIDDSLLPCSIPDRTRSTWKHFFSPENTNRRLFPINCNSYIRSNKPNKLRPKVSSVIFGFLLLVVIVFLISLIFNTRSSIEKNLFYIGFFNDVRSTIVLLTIVVTVFGVLVRHLKK